MKSVKRGWNVVVAHEQGAFLPVRPGSQCLKIGSMGNGGLMGDAQEPAQGVR